MHDDIEDIEFNSKRIIILANGKSMKLEQAQFLIEIPKYQTLLINFDHSVSMARTRFSIVHCQKPALS